MTSPLVSVVLPTRDRARWLGRAVDSVLAQTYRPLELVVVDDGSSDGTDAVLARYGDAVTVVRQPPAGAYAARNLGLARSTGPLVAFIDSDDRWLPHRLAAQVPLLDDPDVGLVFGDAVRVGPTQRRRRTCFDVTPPRRGRVAGHLAWGNCIPTITVLVRRACLEEVGGFPESHDLSADYLTWFRIALRHEVDLVDDVVAEYTVHGEGISADLGRALETRLSLFDAELVACDDPSTRHALRRTVFSLGLGLAMATVRRRAHRVERPWTKAREAMAVGAPLERVAWATSLVARRVAARA